VPINVSYKGKIVGEYFADIVVQNKVILELKAQEKITGAYEAQILNYLKASEIKVGLLVNFYHPKATIKRLVF
ncbi:MAG: GxxExxY protein, partial [Candidatus Scalindua sp.]|nr:GxxExxY protein [Candidatus Scalindua sp.]